jgi:quinol monooxygenase YgiN
MYSRYTEFQFDADRRDDVYRFWQTVAVPSAARQPGWRAAYILASDEQDGVLRTFTVWDSADDFQRYYASPEHQVLGAGIKASGLRGVARDGLDAWFGEVAPPAAAPLLRVTRARIDAEHVDAASSYWREQGGPLMRAAEGCLRADGYWGAEAGEFILIAEWASQAAAQAFLSGPDHKAFGAAMDAFGSVVSDRIVGDRIG